MNIDKMKVEEVLAAHGLSFDDVINAGKHKTPKAEQDWIYLIHHMHPPEKESQMETLHHCFMFEKKGLKGKKYIQKHKKDGKVFQHLLDVKDVEQAPKEVYDHLNNAFKVVVKEIEKNKYAVITGPVSLKKTKWSDQDRN